MKKQSIFKALHCFLFALLLIVSYQVAAADAAVYYVSTTGSDTNPGTSSQPWRTPSKAWQTAQAGDTVYFRAGTYTISSQVTAANNGTSGSPITFKNHTGESVTFDASGSAIIPFLILKTYHVFDGFTIKSQQTGIWFGGWDDGNASGGKVQNCNFIMTVGYPDNNGSVMQGGVMTQYITVQNNTFTMTGSDHPGDSGVWMDYSQHNVVKNNTISGYHNGIYFKHANPMTQTGNEFSYNYIYNCYYGIQQTGNYVLVKHNIFNNISADILGGNDGGGGSGCKYNTMDHNTFAGAGVYYTYQGGGLGACQYNTFTNNIFRSKNLYDPWDSQPLYMTADYNLFVTGNIVNENRTDYTLATWRTFSGQDAHSLSATPTFTGAVTPGSPIANYALTSGSVGHNAANDGTDMGANVSLVGPNAGGSHKTLSAPQLRQ